MTKKIIIDGVEAEIYEEGEEIPEKYLIRDFPDKYRCDKCGGRIPITLPRHLRKRFLLCKCKD